MPSPISASFLSRGLSIAGHLYAPNPDAPDRKHAAIVVGHPTSGVKKQAAGLYAHQLAEAGVIALAFDAGYQGESGGEPHGREDPYQRVEEFKSAVTYLSTLDESQGVRVDAQCIDILGLCASSGYVSFAAQTDLRMRVVATVSAGCFDETTRHGFEGSGPSSLVTPELLFSLLKQSGDAGISAAKTGEPLLVAM